MGSSWLTEFTKEWKYETLETTIDKTLPWTCHRILLDLCDVLEHLTTGDVGRSRRRAGH